MVRYCRGCGEVVAESIKECSCGSHSFISGELQRTGKTFACICGNNSFRPTSNIDFTDKAYNHYECETCHRPITTEYYRSKQEKKYWEGK